MSERRIRHITITVSESLAERLREFALLRHLVKASSGEPNYSLAILFLLSHALNELLPPPPDSDPGEPATP